MSRLYEECENAIRDNKCSECNDFYQCSLTDFLEIRDKQIRAEAIDKFQEWLKTQIVGIDSRSREIIVVIGDKWVLASEQYKKEQK